MRIRLLRPLSQASWRVTRCFGVFSILILAAAPAFAQEAESAPENSTIGWVFRWLNFAIVFAGIVYVLAKGAGPYFRNRSEDITRLVREGARAREAAERTRREIEQKMAGLDTEIAALRAEAKRDAEAEAARLRLLAKQEAQTIEHAAQAEIAAARHSGYLDLKMFAARLAIRRAESLLQNEMTPQAESGLLGAFVAELGRSAN